MKGKISFLVMAGKLIGLGHFRRSKVIKEELCRRGISSQFMVMTENDEDWEEGEQVFSNLSQVISYIALHPTPVLVLDMPPQYYHADILQELRSIGTKIVLVDDSDEFNDQTAYDLLFACSIRFAKIANLPNVYYGPKYIIINPTFTAFIRETRSISSKPYNILLSFGGTDPNNIALKVLRILNESIEELGPLNVDLISGIFADPIPQKIISKSRHHIRIFKNVDDMSQRLWNTDIAVISGGMTLYEASCLGTPTITVNQNEDQNNEAEIFDSYGAIINAGMHDSLDQGSFITLYKKLILEEKRIQLSLIAQQLVDGEGLNRIVKELMMLSEDDL